MIREQEMIRDKLTFFKEKNQEVHISIKSVDQFYNGWVIRFRGDDEVVFNDNVLGETLIFLSQIRSVEPKKERK